MNEQLRPPALPVTTQAAEGMPRRRWSVAELEEMTATGIIAEDERIELIGGEVVPMSPKGRRHEIVRGELAFHMSRQAPPLFGSRRRPSSILQTTRMLCQTFSFTPRQPECLMREARRLSW
jgi:hypothetical protein